MKKLDATFGRLALSVMPPPLPCRGISSPLASLLLIRPGGIGDAVLLAPAIHALKKSHPTLHLTVLAEQRNAAVFSLIQAVDTLLCYDRPGELLQTLRNSYDAVIDTEQWHRLSALVARMVPAAVRIGFATNERRRMFHHSLPYCHDDYEAVSFAHLLAPLGIDVYDVGMDAPFLSITEQSNGAAVELLQSLRGQQFVALFPGASIPERRWSTERFRSVAEAISEMGAGVVVVGGKDDRLLGERITSGGVGLNLAGQTTLAVSAAVLHQSRLLLSGDTGILHIAVGLGVPTISLFGPGRAKKWAPRGKQHIVINKGLSCSPCTTFGTTPPCPDNCRCMNSITVDEVIAAVRVSLQQA